MSNPTPCDQIESLFYKLNNSDRKDVVNKLLSTFSNGGNMTNFKELATDMSHDHRTLIQQKFSLFLAFCKVLSHNHENGNFDARNEYACETASKIMKMLNGYDGVPFI